jgi:ATP/ADP translocase
MIHTLGNVVFTVIAIKTVDQYCHEIRIFDIHASFCLSDFFLFAYIVFHGHRGRPKSRLQLVSFSSKV